MTQRCLWTILRFLLCYHLLEILLIMRLPQIGCQCRYLYPFISLSSPNSQHPCVLFFTVVSFFVEVGISVLVAIYVAISFIYFSTAIWRSVAISITLVILSLEELFVLVVIFISPVFNARTLSSGSILLSCSIYV